MTSKLTGLTLIGLGMIVAFVNFAMMRMEVISRGATADDAAKVYVVAGLSALGFSIVAIAWEHRARFVTFIFITASLAAVTVSSATSIDRFANNREKARHKYDTAMDERQRLSDAVRELNLYIRQKEDEVKREAAPVCGRRPAACPKWREAKANKMQAMMKLRQTEAKQSRQPRITPLPQDTLKDQVMDALYAFMLEMGGVLMGFGLSLANRRDGSKEALTPREVFAANWQIERAMGRKPNIRRIGKMSGVSQATAYRLAKQM